MEFCGQVQSDSSICFNLTLVLELAPALVADIDSLHTEVTVGHSVLSTKGKLNVFPIQLPYVGPFTLHSPPGPSDQRRSLMEGSWYRQKQCRTPAVAKIYSLYKSYKNTGPWKHNAGALPKILKGQGMYMALELGLPLLLVCVWASLPGGAGWGLWGVKLWISASSWTHDFNSCEQCNFWSCGVFPLTQSPLNTGHLA